MNDSFDIKMPHFGEGMHYAKVISILKKIGDHVEEDSDVIVIETDKASLEVSTPVSGHVSEIHCHAGQTVKVGMPMLSIRQHKENNAQPISDPFQQKRRFQLAESRPSQEAIQPADTIALPKKQAALIKALRKSQALVIPASLEIRIDWQHLQEVRRELRSLARATDVPSSLELICWSVAQAMQKYEKLRAKIIDEDRLVFSKEAKIGIALAAAEDTINMSTVSVSTTNSFTHMREIFRSFQQENPKETTTEYHSLAISDMSALGIINANPVIVYPSVATLFIGAPYWAAQGPEAEKCRQYCNLVLAFDHRAMNGAYAAKFLSETRKNIEKIRIEDISTKMDESSPCAALSQ